ncbi:hypothetical protein [Massilia sp. S19_KUP03_FR1]|uniref:hypothetical protein n=1 Tax=Massilia sp. S19_KUP03_FR1 TaxID=3025503 RepID=UPI002FCCC044
MAPVAIPIAGAPTVAGTWKKVADEGHGFTVGVGAGVTVRYGAGNAWIYKKFPGTASNAWFGKDPAVNVVKTVEAFTPAGTAPVATPPVKLPPAAGGGKVTTPGNARLKKVVGLTRTFFDAATFTPV